MDLFYSAGSEIVRGAVQLVYFKQYLLKLDIQSRKFVINACIDFINSSKRYDDETKALKHWFEQFAIITEDEDNALRKEETKSHARWDTLFELKNNECLRALVLVTYPLMK